MRAKKPTPNQLAKTAEIIPVPIPSKTIIIHQPAKEVLTGFLAKNTKRGYERDLMDFFKVNRREDLATISMERVAAVRPADVATFRDELLAKPLKPGSIARKLSAIRSFYNNLMLMGAIAFNPAHPKLVRAPKRGDVHKMDALTTEEARAFLNQINRSVPEGRRDYAVIMTDLHLGLRRSEALAIRTDQFKTSQDTAYIVFRSKGEKERLVSINQDLEEALKEYSKDRGSEPGWLFPGRGDGHLSGDQFWRIVRKYLKKAGIKKRVGTHGLRATFITLNIERGTPLPEIQRTVGHSRPDTTLGYARDLEMIKSKAPKAMEGLRADTGVSR